jgi:hypothetical protein
MIQRWDQNEETISKSRSPNSIYFYLKKHNGDEQKAAADLDSYRSKMKGGLKRPNQVSFWTEKGYNDEEAKELVSLSQSKRSKGKRIKSPFDGQIKNLMVKLDLSYEEAHEMACSRRRNSSPRRIEYWMQKGYSKHESMQKVSEAQRIFSQRCIEYWIGAGHSEDEAKRLLSESQDKLSLRSIMRRLDCNVSEALAVSNERRFVDEEYQMMLLYFTYRVRQSTEKVYKSFSTEIDPENKRGNGYHLDHIKPISQCFLEGMTVEETSHPSNLQIISANENQKKGKQ